MDSHRRVGRFASEHSIARDPGRPKPTKRGKCYGENHRAPTDETIDGKWLVRGMIKLTQTEHFVDVECLGR
jgi:hypothetical protein